MVFGFVTMQSPKIGHDFGNEGQKNATLKYITLHDFCICDSTNANF